MLTTANTSSVASSTAQFRSSQQAYSCSPEETVEVQSSSKQMLKVLRRNERERRRVHKVNLGFEMLSRKIPGGNRKKLSKAETLRQALLYIKYLQQILDADTSNGFCNGDQMSSIPTPAPMSSNLQYPHHSQWNFQLPYDQCKQ